MYEKKLVSIQFLILRLVIQCALWSWKYGSQSGAISPHQHYACFFIFSPLTHEQHMEKTIITCCAHIRRPSTISQKWSCCACEMWHLAQTYFNSPHEFFLWSCHCHRCQS